MNNINLLGQTIHHFRLLEELGQGGMGAVYKAHQLDLDRTVALKVLKPELNADQSYVARFQQEARNAARLDHRNIVSIYEVGAVGAMQFIAMKYIAGQTIAQLIRAAGPLRLDQTLQLLEQVADALDYAHSQGIIHRDIKPSNVMVTPEGWVFLTDFGLARATQGQSLTQKGMVIGTPNYMAPELASGETATRSTDLYAFALVAYEMLTGKLPFEGVTSGELLVARLTKPPRPPSDFRPDLPRAVEEVIMRALARQPQARYGSARELVAALRAAAQGGPANVRPTFSNEPTVMPRPDQFPYAQPAAQQGRQDWSNGPQSWPSGQQSRQDWSNGPQSWPSGQQPGPAVYSPPAGTLSPQPRPGLGGYSPPSGTMQAGQGGANRLPLILALVGVVVLLGIGGLYMLLQPDATDDPRDPTAVVGNPTREPTAKKKTAVPDKTQKAAQELEAAQAAFAEAGGMDEAIEHAQAALEHDPKSAEAHVMLAMLYNARGQDEDALAEADQAIKLAPENPLGHVWRASALGGLNRHDESLQSAERAIELAPDLDHSLTTRATVWTNIAIRDNNIAHLEDATKDADRALELASKQDAFARAMAYGAKGYVIYGRYVLTGDQGLVSGARDAYNRAIGLQDQIAWLHSNLGYFDTFLGSDHYQDARDSFARAIERDPKYGHAYAGLGWVDYYTADYNAAIENFTKAIDLNDQDADALNGRAESHYSLALDEDDDDAADLEQAIADQEAAIKIDPKREYLWLKVGQFYSRQGDTEKAHEAWREAIELYQQAIARNRENARSYSGIGWAYINLADYNKALTNFEQALTLNEKLVEAHQGKAEVLYYQGDSQGACGWLDHALTIMPGDANLEWERNYLGCSK